MPVYPRAVQLAELRAAVDGGDDPRPTGPLLRFAVINQRLDAIAEPIVGMKYAEAASGLAPLLHHLYVLADRSGTTGEAARAALHDAYRLVASVAGLFRQADIAAIASERPLRIAADTGDPLRVAISAFHRSSRYLGLGDYAGGLRVLERVRSDVAAPSAVATQVLLRCAVLAARAGRLDRADEYLAEARATRRDGQAQYRGIDASRQNIDVHWCALPVEALGGSAAVGFARRVRGPGGDRLSGAQPRRRPRSVSLFQAAVTA